MRCAYKEDEGWGRAGAIKGQQGEEEEGDRIAQSADRKE